MADITAQILVNGSHLLLLGENDRPSWQCIHLSRPPQERRPTITWIPSGIENIFKDGLLMIAIHCLANEEIIKRAKSMSKEIMNNRVDSLSSILTDEQLAELHTMNRKDSGTNESAYHWSSDQIQRAHLVITILSGGSSVRGQLEELKQHNFVAEVAHTEVY